MNTRKHNHDGAQIPAASRWRIPIGLMVLSAAFVAFLAAYFGSLPSSPALKPGSTIQPKAVARPTGPFAATIANKLPAPFTAPDGMVWIPGGEFSMGSDAECESLCSLPGVTRDALPIHRVSVDGFWMDATEVTNRQFERFVTATGYVTVAEQMPTQEGLAQCHSLCGTIVPNCSSGHRRNS